MNGTWHGLSEAEVQQCAAQMREVSVRARKSAKEYVDALVRAGANRATESRPKAVYTLHPPRMYLADRLMLALAIVGAGAAWYLAVYGH